MILSSIDFQLFFALLKNWMLWLNAEVDFLTILARKFKYNLTKRRKPHILKLVFGPFLKNASKDSLTLESYLEQKKS